MNKKAILIDGFFILIYVFMSFLEEVKQTSVAISKYIKNTELFYSHNFSKISRNQIWFKQENKQYTGSFKIRGALSKLISLSKEKAKRGVIAASTGNHGLAVAYASKRLGLESEVYVPNTTQKYKVEKIKSLGSKVIYYGQDCLEAEIEARKVSLRKNCEYISPYNDSYVIQGQGTIADEITNQIKKLDIVIVSVGGGGLISGISQYLKLRWPDIQIVGCSPKNSAVMLQSISIGKILEIESKFTLSDGTAGGLEKGSITFPFCKSFIDRSILVSEQDIKKAMKLYFKYENQIIEGAAGVAIAALLKLEKDIVDKRIGVVICGGNIQKTLFNSIVNNQNKS